MAAGVRAVVRARRARSTRRPGGGRSTTLDIGGGLPVNFASDEVDADLRATTRGCCAPTVPGLFDGRYGAGHRVRPLAAGQERHGAGPRRVRQVGRRAARSRSPTRARRSPPARSSSPTPGRCGSPALDAKGRPKDGDPVVQDIAGPCCFAGDLLAQGARRCRCSKRATTSALLDTGAYYFSSHFAYNSLPRPAVYGYHASTDGSVTFALVRPAQTVKELLTESGAAEGEALTRLAQG